MVVMARFHGGAAVAAGPSWRRVTPRAESIFFSRALYGYDGGPFASRSLAGRTQRRAVVAAIQLRLQNSLSCVQPLSPELTTIFSLLALQHDAHEGLAGAGHGTDSTARPRPSTREARDHREAAGVSPFEHFEHLEHLDRSIACTSSPLRASVTGGRAVRARREGAPGGGGGGSCSARDGRAIPCSARRTSDKPSLYARRSTTRPSSGR
ncbi:hypothetical protein T492DRAFT_167888 [Pavlovales sp. CCMP2436]|nr:hypothetical protein T492DRAFT_167888 [Pavlovales sp. CCMP2436]